MSPVAHLRVTPHALGRYDELYAADPKDNTGGDKERP